MCATACVSVYSFLSVSVSSIHSCLMDDSTILRVGGGGERERPRTDFTLHIRATAPAALSNQAAVLATVD